MSSPMLASGVERPQTSRISVQVAVQSGRLNAVPLSVNPLVHKTMNYFDAGSVYTGARLARTQ